MTDYTQTITSDTLAYLVSIAGEENVSARGADLDQHARDQSFHAAHRPAAVVWPQTAAQVSAIVKYANERRIPVTAWGAGSSLEGNPIPVCGGIVLDMLRMNQILKVYDEDFQVDVQPGITYKDMNATLGRHGLFFAPDPGANASIGGMIANNAAGTRSLRYGTTRDNVLRLEIVLASGEIIRTGTRAAKSSSGYDLLHLFVGSEGTLGIVTEATLQLAPLPEKFSAATVAFPAIEQATRAVSSIMGSGLTPAALEFMDVATVHVLNASGAFDLPEHPTLLLEFHSASDAGLSDELSLVEAICQEEGSLRFEPGLGRSERDRIWEARHQTYEIVVRSNPGSAFLIVDVAAPVSRYSELVLAAHQAMTSRGLNGYLVGHAGDGNLHPLIPYAAGDESSYAVSLAADQEIVRAAIAMDGTATGEHGIGIGKRQFMALEHGSSVATMRAIKQTFDPNGILNPGKIFED